MIEKQMEIDSSEGKLSGTICLPSGKSRFPFVLMVHGSGPLDRDENMKGQKLDVFNAFAQSLAMVGVASLRYDKRGCGNSSGDYYMASYSDLVEDAMVCLDALEQLDVCITDQVYVLGHSEGSIIAPQMSIIRPSIAGIILLCPFVQTAESIIVFQAAHIQESINNLTGVAGFYYKVLSRIGVGSIDSQRKLIERLKRSTAPTIRYWFRKHPANRLREVLELDPEEIFRAVTTPMLLIGGEKDIQCDPADVGRIAELTQAAVSSHVIQDLTHVLRFDQRKPSIFNYGELIKKPVEKTVLNLVSAWLQQQICVQR